MDVLELLKNDHQRVSDLFYEAETSGSWKKKRVIFESIRMELELHSFAEETVFYPTLLTLSDLHDRIEESFHEHRELMEILARIDALPAESPLISGQLMRLKQRVEHHVHEEEHEIFPKVRQILSPQDRENLGERVKAAKQEKEEAA
jgi:iron-sulfur cluster repair protein YtfE (RIC family)